MGPRTVKYVLFLSFFVTIPVPYYMGELEFAPVLRAAFIVGLGLVVMVDAGVGGLVTLMALLGGVQVLFWGGAQWAVSGLAARLLCASVDESRRIWFVSAVAAALLSVGLTQIYATPLSSLTPHSTLREIFR